MKNLLRLMISIGLLVSLIIPVNSANAISIGSSLDTVIDSNLIDELRDATEPVEVIVTFHGDQEPTNKNIKLLEDIGIDIGFIFEALPMTGVLVTKQQVDALAEQPEVRSVYSNEKLDYFNEDAKELTGVNDVQEDSEFAERNSGQPVTGDGVGVVVNDSGVDGTHDDHKLGENLVQNVLGTTNLNALNDLLPKTILENQLNTDFSSGHGTHVTGTVGGTGERSDGKYKGVAPDADLIGYGSGAGLFVLDGIGGFDYALENQSEYNIQVITNSWGGSGDFDPEHPINIASKKAHDAGITVLFAGGNAGPDQDTLNPYAKAPWVIGVAAGDKDGELADFSSRGLEGDETTFEIDGETFTSENRPTVTAPGENIISTMTPSPSAVSGQSDKIATEHKYSYGMLSGTSMATPHVAGIVALMLEANPELSPQEIKEVLGETATDMPGYEAWEVGAGYVNAYDAVEEAFAE